MAEVIWAEPALNDLDAIADYIALDNPEAARRLVQKIFEHIDHLERHPRLGSRPQELKGWRYRQIVEPPCRIFYREDWRTSHDTSRHEIRAPAQDQTTQRSRTRSLRATLLVTHPSQRRIVYPDTTEFSLRSKRERCIRRPRRTRPW